MDRRLALDTWVDSANSTIEPDLADVPRWDGFHEQKVATSEERFGGTGRLVRIDAAAHYLGVSRATVERLVYRGDLPIVKVGGSTRYDVQDLDRYIEINRRRNRRRRP